MIPKNKFIRGQKAQIFILFTAVAVTISLFTAFILLDHYYADKSTDEHFGSYESGMINAIIDGDRAFISIDQAAGYAASDAMSAFSRNGGVDIAPENGEDTAGPKCGTYVYNLWNNEQEDCYPMSQQTFASYLDTAMNTRLGALPDKTLHKELSHSIIYEPTVNSTTIWAITADKLDFYIFKNNNYKDNTDIQKYLSTKSVYGGDFIWPVPGHYTVSSCFGYRGTGTGGNANHGGIDIPAPPGTPVVAAADGTVADFLPNYNGIIIDHGGIRTIYLHMSKVDVQKDDTVTQGQKIGEVGGKGPLGANQYADHLHFEVSPKEIGTALQFQGVAATSVSGGRTDINPICIFPAEYFSQNHITLTVGDNEGCKTICDGKNCADPSSCATDGTRCLYKFCGVYTQLMPQNTVCQTTDNTDWKVSNLMVSSNAVSGDQTLKITTTIENTGKECISVQSWPIITDTATGKEYTILDKTLNTAYTKSSIDQYTNIDVECIFSTDPAAVQAGQRARKCVLPAPSNDQVITYKIHASAVDAKTRVDTSFNRDQTVRVTKPLAGTTGDTAGAAASNAAPTVTLTKTQQGQFDKTKKNLETLGLINYIDKICQENSVPTPIMLGLITQESGGNPDAKSKDKNGNVIAVGMTQVVKSLHKAEISSECNYDAFDSDAQCQVRVGVRIMKGLYIQYGAKNNNYKCAAYCDPNNHCQDAIDATYTSWEAALRAYNGLGCKGYPDFTYVDKVKTYAQAWGYAGASITKYQEVSRDEVESKGILGTYSIKPSFKTTINFDMRLIDELKTFAKDINSACSGSDQLPRDCVNTQVAAFNKRITPQYAQAGWNVQLDTYCEAGDAAAVAGAVEHLDQCADATQTGCWCDLNSTSALPITLQGSTDGTQFLFTDAAGAQSSFGTAQIITDENNKNIGTKNIALTDIVLYKTGENTYQLKSKSAGDTHYCAQTENQVRLCLKTNYTYDALEKDKRVMRVGKENITIKFAITVRDNIPPAPVTGFELTDEPHAKDALMIVWNKNPEKDVVEYKIYFADHETDITGKNMSALQKTIPIDSVNVLNHYEIYDDIVYTGDPYCINATTADGQPYCVFKYPATKDGKGMWITLDPNVTYYLSASKKFIRIISASAENMLKENKEKAILITAIDSAGNEIGTDQAVSGKNMRAITVKDLREPGLVVRPLVQMTTDDTTRRLKKTLSWLPVKIMIDGSNRDTGSVDHYDIYNQWTSCTGDFCMVQPPYARIASTTQTSIDIDVTDDPSAKLGVVAIDDNGKGYYAGFVPT